MSYSIKNNEIFSVNGKLVAKKNDDGEIIYAPGMKSAHAVKLKAWLNGEDIEPAEEVKVVEEDVQEVEATATGTESDWRKNLGDWTFDRTLGVQTPAYREFVKKYNLSIEEQAELIVLKLRTKNFVKGK